MRARRDAPKLPFYDPMMVAELVVSGKRRITTNALDAAAEMDVAEPQVWEYIRKLAERGKFCRTVESTRCPGQLLDEWKIRCEGQLAYVKIKIQIDQQMNTVTLCVLSFSKNEEQT
ncbi:MAG: hypothetical protein WA215_09850 [Candidatus Cybelea sp.]